MTTNDPDSPFSRAVKEPDTTVWKCKVCGACGTEEGCLACGGGMAQLPAAEGAISSPASQACINCSAKLPPPTCTYWYGANDVGPFCERCDKLIKVHTCFKSSLEKSDSTIPEVKRTQLGGLTYLECPCCGDDGAASDGEGAFYDGQPLICGCPGMVSIDDNEDDPWINNGDAECLKCGRVGDRWKRTLTTWAISSANTARR